MINPFIKDSTGCTPLNNTLKENTLYNLVSAANFTVLTNGEKLEAQLELTQVSARQVVLETTVYPIYHNFKSNIFFAELLQEP
jgi:hypothetical protein